MTGSRRPPPRFDEARAVALFSRAFGPGGARGVVRGIGDDAAVLAGSKGRLVVTVDASVEGTHFRRELVSLADVGFRAFQAALSDLAAMGATPLAALSALTLPRGFSARELAALVRGQAEAARTARCPIVGGNVARAPVLSVTTTVLGRATRTLGRDGARPHDECWLVGDVGLAAAGFAWLERSGRRRPDAASRRCVRAWRRPSALVSRGVALLSRARAAIDVSDGLAGDATRLADASGCRLVLDEPALRGALDRALVVTAARLGRDALDFALYGGEDYALVAAGSGARRPSWARRIGWFERGAGGFLETAAGRRVRLGGGFDHLAR
ncbi:MAG TPA: thiamine-phosphate kinase [Polyangiaceae bacterium]|nr:thiamine-phosphate kinase [Polyangiaceae bacterium]